MVDDDSYGEEVHHEGRIVPSDDGNMDDNSGPLLSRLFDHLPRRISSTVFSEELDNETCIGCHNVDILDLSKEELAEQVEVPEKPLPPKPKPPYMSGELRLAIDMDKYGGGVHGEMTCAECHQDVEEIPHLQRLKGVDCAGCHDVEEVVAGAHGRPAGAEAPPCIGCHDAHYGKGADA